MLLLIVAAFVSLILGDRVEAIVIIAIVVLAGILGFVQEHRAERALEALKKMAAPTASVMRDGEENEISAKELVPGGIILLRTGDQIPADARLLEAINLKIDKAPLTGESIAVEKTSQALSREEAPVGDRKNIVFMSTTASYGWGKAVVVATGMATGFGRIAGLL